MERKPKGLDWIFLKSPKVSLYRHLKYAVRTYKQMRPRAKVYGLRYYYDLKYRSTCRKKALRALARKRYGTSFLSNRKKWKKMLVRRDGRWCAKCRKGDRKLTIDHITPVAQGGMTEMRNLQLLCVPCHAVKTSLDTWLTNVVRNDTLVR